LQKLTKRRDFTEIRPNFLPQQAVLEAQRCLYCFDAPCKGGCPAGIDIPHFIQGIRSGNLKRAARLINEQNPLGSVCGRVCPVERLCEENCTVKKITGRAIHIGMLQRFATDSFDYQHPPVPRNGRKVAVIGSGPAGLACARELNRKGCQVTVFESKNVAGGMVALGVPEYRCPHDITAREVDKIAGEGVEIKLSTPMNQNVQQLFDLGYEAVFIGVGLTRSIRPDIPGGDLKGVYMGLDFLNRIGTGDVPEVGKKVIVVGGGDTALDCARCALRLGAEEATIMYRRSMVELPADKEEIEQTFEEGVIFRTLTQPVALIGDDEGILRAVEAVTVKLGPPDASGRRSPVEIKGSSFRLACSNVIFAVGTEPSNLLKKLIPDGQYERGKFPKVDGETLETSIPGVFAGGDVVNMGATVVQAVAEGKRAAEGILRYLESKAPPKAAPVPKPEKAAPARKPKPVKAVIQEEFVDDEEIDREDLPEAETGEDADKKSEDEGDIARKREEIKKKWKQKLIRRKLSKKKDKDKTRAKKPAEGEGPAE
jgi:glutamate synthase (NADPH/NADH) small chain